MQAFYLQFHNPSQTLSNAKLAQFFSLNLNKIQNLAFIIETTPERMNLKS